MAKFKNVLTTENLVDFLDQQPRVDIYNKFVYFSCPYCRQEALEELEKVLCKKGLENVKDLNLEFGTLIFDPETHNISCCSRPTSDYDDQHAVWIEEDLVERYLKGMDYGEYLDAKFQDRLEKIKGGNNELLQ